MSSPYVKSGVVVGAESGDSVGAVSVFKKTAARARAYVQLTKPTIVLLFGITGLAALVMEGSLLSSPLRFWMVFAGMVLTAGSANAFNQYIDRDIDAVMKRTREKRPLPSGRLKPQSALMFALITGTIGTWLLYCFGTLVAAAWGVFTIAFYVGVYTMYLKRLTPYNIVIGGAAGATAPLIGWAAASGHVSVAAWIMFAIIFIWTPPHFWALALCLKDEYAGVSVPMLPVVKGEARTRREIFAYTLVLVPLTFSLYFVHAAGKPYLAAAFVLGAGFIQRAWAVLNKKDLRSSWRMFGYSIVYLLLLFVVLMIDTMVRRA